MWRWGRKARSYKGQHVVVIGGSTGIGLAIAKQFAARGANITLIARRQANLQTAAAELEELVREKLVEGGEVHPKINICSMDITETEQVESGFEALPADLGPIDVLVCSAGMAIPGLFNEQTFDVFRKSMNLNYLGNLAAVKQVLPGMIKRKHGHIVLVSSALAVCGFAGYASYAPTKWALRGLADCLRNELKGSGVEVSIAYPPDTDTPGYATENKIKPAITVKISDFVGGSVFKPEQVAEQIVKGVERGHYHLPSPDFGQNLMVSTSAALTPRSYPLLLELLLAPFVVLALRFLGLMVDRMAAKA